MTKFLDFYSIFPIPDPKEFLGISPDRQSGRILTTLGKSFVLVLDVSNNKQKHSWTIIDKLSTKVVYDTNTEKYVGVFGNRTVRCWDETTEDINKSKKLKFQKTIEDLITNEAGNVFVVYNDGFMEPLTIALQNRKEKITTLENELSQPFKLIKPLISTLNDGRQLYTCFKRCKRTDKLSLISYFLADDGAIIRDSLKEHIICQPNLDIKAVGYAVIEAEHGVVLLTIWSDKRIFMLDILDKNSINQAPGKYVSMIGEIDVNSPLCLAGVSKNFVVIYGATTNKDGGLLLLYNTQYKVIKAKQYFKVFFDIARVWPLKEHILLALGQNLAAVKYRISKALLAELIGTQISNTYDSLIEEEQTNDVEDLEENLNFLDNKSKDSLLYPSKTGNAKDSILAQEELKNNFSLANGRTIPFESFQDFESQLNSLRHVLLHVDVVESNRENPEIDVVSNLFDHDFTHPLILNLVQHMENCGSSEQEISEKLITVLIKTDSKKDIYACLSRYSNYSEKTLAKSLSFVLNKCSEKIDEAIQAKNIIVPKGNTDDLEPETNGKSKQKGEKKTDNGLGKRRRTLSRSSTKSDKSDKAEKSLNNTITSLKGKNIIDLNTSTKEKLNFQFLDFIIEQNLSNIHTQEKISLENLPFEIKLLNKILSHNFHAERMSACLRTEISFQDMFKLLKYLYILIKCKDVFQFELYPKYHPSSADFELQIFRWFGCLINAHFQQMILSKDKHLVNILYRWHKLFSLYKQEAQQLQETAAILYKIVQKSKNPVDTNNVKWYSIEGVDLF